MLHTEPLLGQIHGGAASVESGSCSSIPSGSSCYSSQSSSPAPFSVAVSPNSLLRPSITRSLSYLLLEEDEEETNVDTGVPASVQTIARSTSSELFLAPGSESPAAAKAPFTEGLARALMERLPPIHVDLQNPSRKWAGVAKEGHGRPPGAPGPGPCCEPAAESRTMAELLSARMCRYEPVDEFFI